jgi:hypothetical protein
VDKTNKQIKFVDSGDTFNYDNDMFIYGAAFSNARTFKCTKDRLENRSLELNDLYIEKISQGYFGQPGQCDAIYASMSNDLLLNDYVRIAQNNNNLAEFNCEVIF